MKNNEKNNTFGFGGFGEFTDIFTKSFTDMFAEATESFNLAMQCKIRRFHLVRSVDVDPDKVSGTGIIASGVIFEDGTVAMRWRTEHKSTAIYANIDEVLAIHGHNGKTVIKYVDAENVL